MGDEDIPDDAENYFDDYEETGNFIYYQFYFITTHNVSFFPNYQW